MYHGLSLSLTMGSILITAALRSTVIETSCAVLSLSGTLALQGWPTPGLEGGISNLPWAESLCLYVSSYHICIVIYRDRFDHVISCHVMCVDWRWLYKIRQILLDIGYMRCRICFHMAHPSQSFGQTWQHQPARHLLHIGCAASARAWRMSRSSFFDSDTSQFQSEGRWNLYYLDLYSYHQLSILDMSCPSLWVLTVMTVMMINGIVDMLWSTFIHLLPTESAGASLHLLVLLLPIVPYTK